MNAHSPIVAAPAAEPALDPGPARRRRNLAIAGGGTLALLAAGAGLLIANSGGEEAAAPPPLPVVTVAAPLQREVEQWDDYVGRFEASRSVEVRPRVSGAVTAIHFRDGAIVRPGQLLFTIDPRPFSAALAEARAGLASAESDLALARADLDRANRLQAEEAVSRSDVDRLTARVRAASAALAAAQARVRSRELDLDFTRVRAPIAGRISDRRVDAGNLVSAGDAGGTLLTTINALDPIYFAFKGSEALYLKGRRAEAGGAGEAERVQVRLQDEADYRWQGRVDFTDNRIDPQAGTMRGRAVIANPGYFLTPGMFGNMRLESAGRATALLVPDGAIRNDQARRIVLTVARDGTVAAKPVETGARIGGLRIVRSGLRPDDRIVIQGVQFAQPGGKVTPKPGRIDPPAATASAPPPPAQAAAQATLAAR